MSDIRAFPDIGPNDVALVGGKALSLAALATAGLPVPPGFCITTAAYRRLAGQSSDALLRDALLDSYRQLGGGTVAVRSSATAEDGAATSFAGQQDTILGVRGETELLEAVARCWASLDSGRAVAYRQFHAADGRGQAMAVVVQQLIDAEVAGVLFTRDPLDPDGRRMLVEAAWGLGESVVSGQVTPDRFHLDRQTGGVLERHLGQKAVRRTSAGTEPVSPEQQGCFCLNDSQLTDLADLGRRVETAFGGPRDVEWAFAGGRFWLLQARPITAASAAERDEIRRQEIAALAERAEPGGTVWARYNLAEVLPAPTPMTWALVRRLLSGRGGLGLMYRDLGFDPDPALADECAYDLVCGRPFCNLSREPRTQFRLLPFEHPFATLKADPRKALYPQPVLNPAKARWQFWLFLPVQCWRLMRSTLRLRQLSRTCADRLRQQVFPEFAAAAAKEMRADYGGMETVVLLDRLEEWCRRTLDDFARDSLKPTVLAAVALGNLERAFAPALGAERVRAVLGEWSQGVRPDAEADLAAGIQDLARAALKPDEFVQRFGHRGRQEMELSSARWAEDPTSVTVMCRGQPTRRPGEANPPDVAAVWERVADEAGIAATARPVLRAELDHLRTYLGLRETAKHYFLMGYAVLRRVLVELDRRYNLAGGVFYLLPEELPRLAAGHDLSTLIAERRRRRAVALSLPVPDVLFSDDLEAVGRPVPPPAGETLQGVPLSAGMAEGPALVLDEPTAARTDGEPYVLVCPSTDPAWVPLFLGARALIMETGGVLSHGAIVAREFGLPAVAGLPGVVRRLRTGQRVRVDGATGVVTVLDELRGPA